MGAKKIQVRHQFRSERLDVNPHTEQMISIIYTRRTFDPGPLPFATCLLEPD